MSDLVVVGWYSRSKVLVLLPTGILKEKCMKAIVYTQYGPPEVLQFTEVEKPTPKDDEVLIKVHAASVNAADWRMMRAHPFLVRFVSGLLRPTITILGADVAGRVEAVGRNAKQYQPGDEVFGDLSASSWGGFAEYVAVPESAIAPKSARLTFEEAAALPMAAVSALQALRDKGKVKPGQTVLINGASGGVGTFAVQIAKALGAEVTAVCSTSKVEQTRALGADYVIDYTQEDFSQNGQRYDVVLAVNGSRPLSAYQRVLAPQGVYIMIGGSSSTQLFQAMILGPLYSRKDGQAFGNLTAKPNPQDLMAVNELVEAGKVTPVIDRRYPLHEVPEAIRYVEQGHAKGKVVITVVPGEGG